MDGKLRNMTSLYLRRGNRFLLLYREGSKVVDHCYTGAAGGHFEPEELNDARACVLRELQEETGLTEDCLENLALRYVTMRLKNGEIRINYYFFADDCRAHEELLSNEGQLRWFDADEMADLPMPFSARWVVQHYLAEGQYTACLYAGAATAEGVRFTALEEFPS